MNSRLSLCGVILAAGESSRMGRDKALLPWPPAAKGATHSSAQTFLSASIFALRRLTETVVVIAGKNSQTLAPMTEACGVSLVSNPVPERGQFSSLLVGMREVLARDCDAAVITLVDCPPLSATSLEKLNLAFEQALSVGQWGVVPENDGRHGHPLFAGRKLIEAFLASHSASNARAIRRAHAQYIEYVSVPDSLVSCDVNTPEEYKALIDPAVPKPH